MSIRRFIKSSPLFTLVLLSAFAHAGPPKRGGTSGGGGEVGELYASRIKWTAGQLIQKLETDEKFRSQVGLTEAQVQMLRQTINKNPTVTANKDLGLTFLGQPKGCLNDRSIVSIICDWGLLASANNGDFLAVVGHEYFSLADIEGNLDYTYSGRIPSITGPAGLLALGSDSTSYQKVAVTPPWAPASVARRLQAPTASDNHPYGFFPPIQENKSLRVVVNPPQGENCRGVLVLGWVPKLGNPVPRHESVRIQSGTSRVLDTIVPPNANARRVDIRVLSTCNVTVDVFNDGKLSVEKEFQAGRAPLIGSGTFTGDDVDGFESAVLATDIVDNNHHLTALVD